MKSGARPQRGKGPAKRRYDSALRRSQAEQTRSDIVDAAYRLLQEAPIHDLSYATVAEELGVATRTVYRHFPTKDDLAAAVAERHIARVVGPARELPRTLPGAAALLRRIYAMLEEEPGTYRLFFHLPVRSQSGVRSFIEAVWGEVLATLPAQDRAAAGGLFELLMSPYAYDVLHANWGLSAEDAARACLCALDALAQALERDPLTLSKRRKLPARFRGPTDG